MSYATTLLPEARVDVFATDPQTIQAARELNGDWRFARVKVNITGGDITTAIQHFSQQKSPELVLIETDRIDQSFTQHLEALAEVCSAGTAAVFIGPENDIALYRRLLDMGATDYLVRPLKTQDLVDVIGKTLLGRLGAEEGRVISVMGAKGGVGTSRIAQILTHAMGKSGEAATLLDCGGTWGLASITYGREPMTNLRDLATAARTQPDTIEDSIQNIAPNVSWVAAGGDPLLNSTLTSDGLESILDVLTHRHPNVIIDLSQSSTGIRAMAFAKSHHIVLVTHATPLALRNARIMIKEIQQMRGADAPLHLVVNATGILPKEELPMRDIQQSLGMPPTATIAFQPDIFARLDTADPDPALTLIEQLISSVQPVLKAITGKSYAANTTTATDTGSLLQRFLKRG